MQICFVVGKWILDASNLLSSRSSHLAASTRQLYTTSSRAVPASNYGTKYSSTRWSHNPRVGGSFYVLWLGHCVRWLLCQQLRSDLRGVEAHARCGGSYVHGGWQFSARVGHCHHRRVLCERWHWSQWSDRFSCVQHNVCHLCVRLVLRYRITAQLLAFNQRLHILLHFHSDYAGCDLQWNHFVARSPGYDDLLRGLLYSSALQHSAWNLGQSLLDEVAH